MKLLILLLALCPLYAAEQPKPEPTRQEHNAKNNTGSPPAPARYTTNHAAGIRIARAFSHPNQKA